MDIQTTISLNEMNARFYNEQAASFSSTRHSSWAGWSKALYAAGIDRMPNGIVDVACGNQRFEGFLVDRFPGETLRAYCVDNCSSLNDLTRAPEACEITFEECDIVNELLEGRAPLLPLNELTVCFGFMHHVPTFDARRLLMGAMYDSLIPGGALIVSFWQFMTVESIAKQAQHLTGDYEELELDENDYILGWQNSPAARRYCHNFDVMQVRDLAPCDDATLFEADGRNGRLNIYLVVKKPLR